MTEPIIGVDPGGAHTGIIARDGDQILYHSLVHRSEWPDLDAYLGGVCDIITRARDQIRLLTGGDLDGAFDHPARIAELSIPIAVEDLHRPTPQMGVIAVQGLIDAAQVIGAISARYRIIRIPPGGHGKGLLAAYPDVLRGPGEQMGTGELRHVRAAWDIAATARTLIRQGVLK